MSTYRLFWLTMGAAVLLMILAPSAQAGKGKRRKHLEYEDEPIADWFEGDSSIGSHHEELRHRSSSHKSRCAKSRMGTSDTPGFIENIIKLILKPSKECCAKMTWNHLCNKNHFELAKSYHHPVSRGVTKDVVELLLKAARCMGAVITLDEETFKKSSCCQSIEVPFWC